MPVESTRGGSRVLTGIAARNVSAWFGSHNVLDRVSLDMPADTISRIGGDTIEDARMELLSNLSFVSVEGLGSNKELWVFCDRASGKNIPVFGTDGICGVSVRN